MRWLVVATAAFVLVAGRTEAAEIKVLSAGAVKGEILPVPGVAVVGPLPKDLQKVTVYSAGLSAKSANPEVARAFLAFLVRPQFKTRFAAAALDFKE